MRRHALPKKPCRPLLCPWVAEFECSYATWSGALHARQQVTRERAQLLFKALSRWDYEGGAGPGHLGLARSEAQPDVPPLANAELVQLQTRVIALENLVIALLADASDWQIELAREGAAYIRPRPGHTSHPLTINAANQMDHLIQRSAIFRVNGKP